VTAPIDFIGDIHGHARPLEALLLRLGYRRRGRGFFHSERRAFFVGDFIDRGPDIPRCLEIVRHMVDGGQARAVMGNHEFNALLYHRRRPDGKGYLRPHTAKNQHQHAATLAQFSNRRDEWNDYLRWFLTLPVFYEADDYRVVHACWEDGMIECVRRELGGPLIGDGDLPKLADVSSPPGRALDHLLKGGEVPLPAGHHFADKDGHLRHDMRYRWWVDPAGATYGNLSFFPLSPAVDRLPYRGAAHAYYRPEEPPVFFGHYWLRGRPAPQAENVCCLDYSVARGGPLVAYRYRGESKLRAENLVAVQLPEEPSDQ
jgi:hypothetical protein